MPLIHQVVSVGHKAPTHNLGVTVDEEAHVERRSLSLREISMLATLFLNFGGLIWGASKITSAVAELQVSTASMTHTLENMAQKMAEIQVEYNARISVLEAQNRERENRK